MVESEVEWLNAKQAQTYLGVGRNTFKRLRNSGRVKSYYPYGQPADVHQPGRYLVRYNKQELREMMEKSVETAASDWSSAREGKQQDV